MKCLVINSENKEIKTVNVDDVTELFNLFKGEITSLDIDDQNVVIVEDIEMAFEELPYGFYFEGELINGNNKKGFKYKILLEISCSIVYIVTKIDQ